MNWYPLLTTLLLICVQPPPPLPYDREVIKELLKTITHKLNSDLLIEFKAKINKEFWSNEAGDYYRKFHDLQKSFDKSEEAINDKYFSNEHSEQSVAHMIHELLGIYIFNGFEGQSIEKYLNRLITKFIRMENTEYDADTKNEFNRIQSNLTQRKERYCRNPPAAKFDAANTVAAKTCEFMQRAIDPNTKAAMAVKIAELCGFKAKS